MLSPSVVKRAISPVLPVVGTGLFLSLLVTGCFSAPPILTTHLRAPHNWSIGILRGTTLDSLEESPECANPVFTKRDVVGPESEFVADPFLIKEGSRWNLFFELFNKLTNKGEIGLAQSADLCSWQYKGVVLAEPFHLSFPFVFKVGASYYMVPESRQASAIRLYQAKSFPNEWVFKRELLSGQYSDPTPVFFNGRWWIFANQAPYTLMIFSSPTLRGPFIPHPLNPIYRDDPSKARPAGRPVVVDGHLIRFVQDNRHGYGKRVRAMRVTRLTTTEFDEEALSSEPLLTGSGVGWNSFGMHHISPVQLPNLSWVVAVDGNQVDGNQVDGNQVASP